MEKTTQKEESDTLVDKHFKRARRAKPRETGKEKHVTKGTMRGCSAVSSPALQIQGELRREKRDRSLGTARNNERRAG